MKALLYCKKVKPYLYDFRNILGMFDIYDVKQAHFDDLLLNGKIVAECDIEVEEIKKVNYDCILFTNTLGIEDLINKCGIDYFSLEEYLKPNWCKEDDLQNLDIVGYAIHIKNLHIFNRPLELNRWTVKKPKVVSDIICDSCTNFGFNCKKCEDYWDYYPLEKAPNNVRIVYDQLEKRVFIPISSKQMCGILNEELTVIVRKYVPKEIR